MESIIAHVIGYLIVSAAFYSLGKGTAYLQQRRPARRFWQLSNLQQVAFFISSPEELDTGSYRKRMTSLGQLHSFAYILNSIKKGYPQFDVTHLSIVKGVHNDDFAGMLKCADIISLGGPKENWVSKMIIEEVKPVFRFGTGYCLINSRTGEQFDSSIVEGAITTDYGIVMRVKNPSNRSRSAFIIAGCHSYGTIAASIFLDEILKAQSDSLPEQFQIAVKCRVDGAHVHDINQIAIYPL